MKICRKCKEEKPLSEYSHKRPTGRQPGLQPRCKSCSSQDTQDWYKNNKDKVKDNALRKAYGFGLDEYKARLIAQNNQCIICLKEFSSGSYGPDSPVVDHCHIYGHIRGILCNECNRGLGYYHDNPAALRRAAQYIEEN